MRTRPGVTVGVASLAVFVVTVLFNVGFGIALRPNNLPAWIAGPVVGGLRRAGNSGLLLVLVPFFVLDALAGFGLMVFFAFRALRAPDLGRGARVLWVCGLVILNALIFPVAWYALVWRQHVEPSVGS